MNKDDLLKEIAGFEGIIHEYHDVWGNKHTARPEIIEAVIAALGYPVENPSSLKEFFDQKRITQIERLIDPVVFINGIFKDEITLRVPAHFVSEKRLLIEVFDEDSEPVTGQDVKLSELEFKGTVEGPSGRFNEHAIKLNESLKTGYYQLRVELDGSIIHSKLIVCPARAYIPERLKHERLWGLGINLFEINSSRNQAIGDLTDLKTIVQWTAKELEGHFVALNPFHHTTNRYPYGISPYSPVSRLYTNPIYIDLMAVEELEDDISSIKAEFNSLKTSALIDYDRVFEKKIKFLKKAFLRFYNLHLKRNTERGRDFLAYIKEEGRDLHCHALYMAIYEYFSRAGMYGWKVWPDGFRHPEAESVRAFEASHQKEILFQKYLQWLFNEQLSAVERTSVESDLSIGLCRDLAIGSLEEGSDVWANQRLFVSGCSVGAPPDAFSPLGQDWGFPPLAPGALRQEGYDFFIKLIRKNLSYAGALRIDHALGLFRLFWIPAGAEPSDGIYIRYPADELLSILALESQRNRSVIIAEDLGTVPPEVRDKLRRFDMLSFRLLYFEKDYSTGEYLPPVAYPEKAVVSTTTHDLPTLQGFWLGRDIQKKKELGRYPHDTVLETDLRERQYDRWRLLRALNNEGLLPEKVELDPAKTERLTEELIIAIYRFLAKTPSMLLQVNLNDLIGVVDQTNLPGTLTEYPNWQIRHKMRLEDIMTSGIFKKLKGLRH